METKKTFVELAQEIVDEMDNQSKAFIKETSSSGVHWQFYEYINGIMCSIIVKKDNDRVKSVIPKSVGKGY